MVNKHPAYQEECKRLKGTLKDVNETLEEYITSRDEVSKEVSETLRQFKHNPDEGSQTYIDLMTNMEFIKFYDEKINGLKRSRKKPYFARIDFTPNRTNKLEKCYIGKSGLTRDSDNYPIIIDWRAPIATLYYEGRLGESSYQVPIRILKEIETIVGNLSLKRQFTIEDSKLLEIFDIDITTNDPLLQKALGASADNRLKDIASTIQAEQNRIIRAEMLSPLIVQGVAGSGKTTIALHRIAYLIYTYAHIYKPESFMIIAPNRLFLNYISEVLPELGVESVKQTTFIDFMRQYIGRKYKLVNPNEKLIMLVNQQQDYNLSQNHLIDAAKFKGSLFFKNVLDKYLYDIEDDFLPKKDLIVAGEKIMRASEIRHIFLTEYKYYPIYKRVSKLKARLKRFVKKKVKELIKKEKVRTDDIVERYYVRSAISEEEREDVLTVINKRDDKVKLIEKESKKLVDNYFTDFPDLKLVDYYTSLFTNLETFEIYTEFELSQELIDYLMKQAKRIKEENVIELEDFAPMVYLKHHLYGTGKRLNLSHVVIDEAQDLSSFQFYVLKMLSYTNSFTIMGDLSQGIHSYRAIKSWQDLTNDIYPDETVNYTTLEKSYRTTIEIMNLANQIIKHHLSIETKLAEPIIRHGKLPRFFIKHSLDKIIKFITQEIKSPENSEINSTAIICKTMKECEKLYESFPKNIKPKLITEDMTEYTSGVMIIPSYLAKGLEFDSVFIVTLDEEYKKEEMDIKLLYIAMTRALHNLYLCSQNQLSPMLQNIDNSLFTVIGD